MPVGVSQRKSLKHALSEASEAGRQRRLQERGFQTPSHPPLSPNRLQQTERPRRSLNNYYDHLALRALPSTSLSTTRSAQGSSSSASEVSSLVGLSRKRKGVGSRDGYEEGGDEYRGGAEEVESKRLGGKNWTGMNAAMRRKKESEERRMYPDREYERKKNSARSNFTAEDNEPDQNDMTSLGEHLSQPVESVRNEVNHRKDWMHDGIMVAEEGAQMDRNGRINIGLGEDDWGFPPGGMAGGSVMNEEGCRMSNIPETGAGHRRKHLDVLAGLESAAETSLWNTGSREANQLHFSNLNGQAQDSQFLPQEHQSGRDMAIQQGLDENDYPSRYAPYGSLSGLAPQRYKIHSPANINDYNSAMMTAANQDIFDRPRSEARRPLTPLQYLPAGQSIPHYSRYEGGMTDALQYEHRHGQSQLTEFLPHSQSGKPPLSFHFQSQSNRSISPLVPSPERRIRIRSASENRNRSRFVGGSNGNMMPVGDWISPRSGPVRSLGRYRGTTAYQQPWDNDSFADHLRRDHVAYPTAMSFRRNTSPIPFSRPLMQRRMSVDRGMSSPGQSSEGVCRGTPANVTDHVIDVGYLQTGMEDETMMQSFNDRGGPAFPQLERVVSDGYAYQTPVRQYHPPSDQMDMRFFQYPSKTQMCSTDVPARTDTPMANGCFNAEIPSELNDLLGASSPGLSDARRMERDVIVPSPHPQQSRCGTLSLQEEHCVRALSLEEEQVAEHLNVDHPAKEQAVRAGRKPRIGFGKMQIPLEFSQLQAESMPSDPPNWKSLCMPPPLSLPLLETTPTISAAIDTSRGEDLESIGSFAEQSQDNADAGGTAEKPATISEVSNNPDVAMQEGDANEMDSLTHEIEHETSSEKHSAGYPGFDIWQDPDLDLMME